ncbi:MAG TPA: NAD(P)-dependent alcohol dehydrogenase [Gemmatimonadaceae bacterium]
MKTQKKSSRRSKASTATTKAKRPARTQTTSTEKRATLTPAYAAQSPTTPLAPFNIQRRDVRPNDVQVEILYCGVCHSDIHMARNEWGQTIYPVVPGHEIVGRVTAVGKKVTRFHSGDLAGVGVMVDSCRECVNCRKGLEQYCTKGMVLTYSSRDKRTGEITQGGYSKRIVTHEDFVYRLSDKLPLANVAPLLCAGITTYSPLRHWKVGKGTKLGVVGLGGLGHMAVKFGASFGAEVTMLSHSPDKEKDARRLGAQKFALTSDPAQLESLAGYFDFILDTVSAKHDYNKYLNLLGLDCAMVCVGIPPTPMEVQVFALMGGRRRLSSSGIGGIPETQEMLDYCGDHDIVSDIELIDISDINDAYSRMLKSDVRYRFVIDMASLT